MAELLPALTDRRARRALLPDAVPDEVQQRLWRAFSIAPSQGNAQPGRILIASTGATRERATAALIESNRRWTAPAPLLLAIAANPSHDPTQKNSDGTMREYWAFDTGLAVGNLMAQATAEGLVAHAMAGFDEPAMRAAFGAPDEVRIVTVVAVAYHGDPNSLPEDVRGRETAPQERLPLETLVAHDGWTAANAPSARELRSRRPR